ncbi:MAG: NAD(P)-dependent oxidoreductase [Spirochaetia bacterium]|jgi:nucleoside-diphosphate-sugar epimerase|nr:NAD(P)-dependent oxidoreductase [Spirochaetia bacterium]
MMDSNAFPFKTVGVTGATGTVASEFIQMLLARAQGVQRITASCRRLDSPKARTIGTLDRIALVEGGILDLPVLQKVISDSEVVYHLAAWLANTVMPETYEEIFAVNCLSTAVVGRLCQKQDKRLIFTSSHSVYFAGPYKGLIAEDSYEFRSDFTNWITAIKASYYDLADRIIAGETKLDSALEDITGMHRATPAPMDPLIYDRDEYHLYCLSKLLAESFALDHGGVVLRLSNVYGPGDESTQAVGEACQRVLKAAEGEQLRVRQSFKKLVPAYLGDINEALFRAANLEMPKGIVPVFTMASQSTYMREDELLRSVDKGLQRIRGSGGRTIETLEPEAGPPAFTYDLSKLKTYLLKEYMLTPFVDGLEAQLRRLIQTGF